MLFPSILFFCCIGTFSVNNNLDDTFVTAVFSFIGYMSCAWSWTRRR